MTTRKDPHSAIPDSIPTQPERSGPNIPNGPVRSDTPSSSAVRDQTSDMTTHSAKQGPIPRRTARSGSNIPNGHMAVDIQATDAVRDQAHKEDPHSARQVSIPRTLSRSGSSTPNGPATPGTHSGGAVRDQTARSHVSPDTQTGNAPSATSGSAPAAIDEAMPSQASLLEPTLILAAEILDGIERVRIANTNRLGVLTRTEPDSDGVMRGFGLDESHPDVARLAAMVDMLGAVEADAVRHLQHTMRRHPLHTWVKETVGVGEKQAARLLAVIGDPYINSAKGQPRTVSALWAYCGLHVLPGSSQPSTDTPLPGAAAGAGGHPNPVGFDIQPVHVGVAPKRKAGVQLNWSIKAKTLTWRIADSCIKHRHSPYRSVYDKRRAHTETTHPEWIPIHRHRDAMRITSKAILRDLWCVARDHHQQTGKVDTDGQPGTT